MARYVVADESIGQGWGHIFSEFDAEKDAMVDRERITSFVFDLEENRLVHVEIDAYGGMHAATADEIADLEDSLKNANPEALAHPEQWGMTASDELPPWAKAPAVAP